MSFIRKKFQTKTNVFQKINLIFKSVMKTAESEEKF